MISLRTLAQKIADLDVRLSALYQQVRLLAAKQPQPMTAIFLQKKLLIDHPRALRLIDRLHTDPSRI